LLQSEIDEVMMTLDPLFNPNQSGPVSQSESVNRESPIDFSDDATLSNPANPEGQKSRRIKTSKRRNASYTKQMKEMIQWPAHGFNYVVSNELHNYNVVVLKWFIVFFCT